MIWMIALLAVAGMAAEQTVYIGTRTTQGKSEGIYRLRFDPETGTLRDVQLAVKTPDPSFLVVHPSRPLVFAVVAAPEGKVRAFAIEGNGDLRLVNEVSSKGSGPAHVQIDRTGRWVATANFGSGSTAVYRIEEDGRLSEAVDSAQHAGKGPHAKRQTGPHAHSVNFSLDNKWMYVADLGIDEVRVYSFDARTGKITPAAPLRTPPGAGPRHLAVGKKRLFVLNEIASSVSVFENGKLLETVSSLPAGFTGDSSAAEVLLSPSGKYLYASNRGADTIAVFKVGNRLTKIADVKVGKTPRGFVLSPDGRYLLAASQVENFIQGFRIGPDSGLLTAVGSPVNAPTPICLRFAR